MPGRMSILRTVVIMAGRNVLRSMAGDMEPPIMMRASGRDMFATISRLFMRTEGMLRRRRTKMTAANVAMMIGVLMMEPAIFKGLRCPAEVRERMIMARALLKMMRVPASRLPFSSPSSPNI